MEIQDSFIQLVEESMRGNWDRDALTDYQGATLQYKDVARKIASRRKERQWSVPYRRKSVCRRLELQ